MADSLVSTYVSDPRVLSVLANKGIQQLFPIQYKTYNLLHRGEDLVARDRTGSGKTIAFSLPIINRMREQKKFVN